MPKRRAAVAGIRRARRRRAILGRYGPRRVARARRYRLRRLRRRYGRSLIPYGPKYRPETKYIEVESAVGNNYQPQNQFIVHDLLGLITQGDGSANRDGSEIRVKRIDFRLFYAQGDQWGDPIVDDRDHTCAEPVRFICWAEKQAFVQTAATMFRDDFYNNNVAAYPITLDPEYAARRRILFDDIRGIGLLPYGFQPSNDGIIRERKAYQVHKSVRFGRRGLPVRYTGAARGPHNQIKYVLMHRNSNFHMPALRYHIRVWFWDS